MFLKWDFVWHVQAWSRFLQLSYKPLNMGLIIEMLTFLLEVLGLEMIMLQLLYKALDALVIWMHTGLVVPTILRTPDGLTEKSKRR